MKALKISEIAAVNALLKGANMSKGDIAGKLALIDAIVATNKIAAEYGEFESITRDKLKGEDFAEMQQQAQRSDLSQAEIVKLNRYFIAYEATVAAAVRAKAEATAEVELQPWSKEQFAALIESNNGYTGQQMVLLQEALL